MTAFQSYLASAKIKKVLNRRPGEEGFSLIELVVVVAVLAVLAAVAIPNFTALTDDARLNSAKQTLVNQYKECEYNSARTGVADHTEVSGTANAVISGVTFAGDAIEEADTGAGCAGAATAAITVGSDICTLQLLYNTGVKSSTSSGDGATAGTWPSTFADCL